MSEAFSIGLDTKLILHHNSSKKKKKNNLHQNKSAFKSQPYWTHVEKIIRLGVSIALWWVNLCKCSVLCKWRQLPQLLSTTKRLHWASPSFLLSHLSITLLRYFVLCYHHLLRLLLVATRGFPFIFVSFDPFLRTSPVCRGRLYLHPEEMAAGIPANLECVCVCVCFILFPLVPQWAEVYGTLQLARPSLQCYFYACVYLHVRISVCACMQIWVHKTWLFLNRPQIPMVTKIYYIKNM